MFFWQHFKLGILLLLWSFFQGVYVLLYKTILERNLSEKEKLKVIPANIREWPTNYSVLRKILDSKSKIPKFELLSDSLQEFFPLNNFIRHTVPLLFRTTWPKDRLERFVKDFRKGAIAPDGLDRFRLDGNQSWSLKSIEENIRNFEDNN